MWSLLTRLELQPSSEDPPDSVGFRLSQRWGGNLTPHDFAPVFRGLLHVA